MMCDLYGRCKIGNRNRNKVVKISSLFTNDCDYVEMSIQCGTVVHILDEKRNGKEEKQARKASKKSLDSDRIIKRNRKQEK